jgi:hypothetical protein
VSDESNSTCPFCGSGVLSDWITPISWFNCGTMILPDNHNRFDQSKRCVIAEVAGLTDRIKRLEEAGGLALGYASKGDFESADEVWTTAKEAKP